MEHLVYCDSKAKVLGKLLNGTKTLIVRGAAGRKLPHSRVFENEILYFIENDGSGSIKAKGTVNSVINTAKLTEVESGNLIQAHQDRLQLTEAQLKRWCGKKYLCLIEVAGVEEIEPLRLGRQKNMDDWITVENIASILEGSGEEYQAVRLSRK